MVDEDDPEDTETVGREIALELGVPAWLATAKITRTWKRSWTERRKEYVDDVAQEAGLEADQLVAELEQDDQRSDLFISGLARAGDVRDTSYRSALAALVGAAFHDQAKIDEVAHLTAQVTKLEPLHLRALYGFLRLVDDDYCINSDTGHVLILNDVSVTRLQKRLDVSVDLVDAILERLTADGFVTIYTANPLRKQVAEVEIVQGRRFHPRQDKYRLTPWGLRALELCLGVDPKPSR